MGVLLPHLKILVLKPPLSFLSHWIQCTPIFRNYETILKKANIRSRLWSEYKHKFLGHVRVKRSQNRWSSWFFSRTTGHKCGSIGAWFWIGFWVKGKTSWPKILSENNKISIQLETFSIVKVKSQTQKRTLLTFTMMPISLTYLVMLQVSSKWWRSAELYCFCVNFFSYLHIHRKKGSLDVTSAAHRNFTYKESNQTIFKLNDFSSIHYSVFVLQKLLSIFVTPLANINIQNHW